MSRAEVLERHGRAYGDLRLAVGWTLGLEGDAAKVSRKWQSHPDKLADANHGASLFRGRGIARNPVVSLAASGLIGVDVDGEPGRRLLKELVPNGFPPTVVVKSGRADGGWHAWFRPCAPARHAKIEFSDAGVGLVSDGYLVCPPALHAGTGRPYVFATGRAPWEIEIAEFPADVYEVLTQQRERREELERGDDTSPVEAGSRHRHLFRLGCAMRRVGVGEETILAALRFENKRRCLPPQDDTTVKLLARDIVTRYAPGVAA
jgi:hypothetical protein